jgi:hypothetical protein
VSLALRKAMTKHNVTKGFQVTRIWPLNPKAMEGKMGCSQSFSTSQASEEKNVEITIEDVHEDDVVFGTQTELYQYYVQLEHTDEEVVIGEDINMQHAYEEAYIAHILSLPEVQPSSNRKRHKEPIIDYTKSIIMTAPKYVVAPEEKVAKKEAVLKAKEDKKVEAETTRKIKAQEHLEKEEAKKLRA